MTSKLLVFSCSRSIHLMLVGLLMLVSFSSPASDCSPELLNTDAQRLLGEKENLCASYAGKVLLVVNTASQCGFTPQFEGLQSIYEKYKDDGFVVLGFPSDQFGGQEYAESEKTAKFCKINYGVEFPMFEKSDVVGDSANALFAGLTSETGTAPKWNFYKYLIDRKGNVISIFDSKVSPVSDELTSAIEELL